MAKPSLRIITLSYDMNENETRRYGQISPYKKCTKCGSNPLNGGTGECNCAGGYKQYNFFSVVKEAQA